MRMLIPDRLRTALLGALLSLGAVLLARGYLRPAKAGGDPGGSVLFSLAVFALCPALTVYGLVASVRGLLFGTPLRSKRTALYTALLLLLVGAFPWVYTDRIVGGRPGNEGGGMLGTLIFLSVGLPGFVLVVVGLVAAWYRED